MVEVDDVSGARRFLSTRSSAASCVREALHSESELDSAGSGGACTPVLVEGSASFAVSRANCDSALFRALVLLTCTAAFVVTTGVFGCSGRCDVKTGVGVDASTDVVDGTSVCSPCGCTGSDSL